MIDDVFRSSRRYTSLNVQNPALPALTPGDFAVVHRKAWFLGKHGEPEALADMLRAECEAKPDRPHPIGFRP